MFEEELPNHIVYSQPVIDFVTVAAEYCLLLEHSSEESKVDFVKKAPKIISLLYLKTAILDLPESAFDDDPERFVTEEDYLFIKTQIEQLLGADDSFLEVFHPDMALSDTPIASFISENLADVYQELKDFIANYQIADQDIMNDALLACLEAFAEHWGQKSLNALKALHALRYSEDFEIEEKEIETQNNIKINRSTFLDFQNEEDENEYNDLLI
jgi:hypothetical protein